jgi:hypothetical protein
MENVSNRREWNYLQGIYYTSVMDLASSSMESALLIHIPCHKDFQMAVETIAKIRSQNQLRLADSIATEIDVRIALSVNGTSLADHERAELIGLSDYFTHYPEATGGDININQGFLKALELQPKYLWILSVNEFLVESALSNLLQTIDSNPQTDLFITNSQNRHTTFEIENVFLGLPVGMSTGLISGVIYNCNTMGSSFSAGPRFAWTGWGQLAVIQYGCQIRGTLVATELPDSKIYRKPITYLDASESNSEFEYVRTGYAHSFFGMILLIYSLFPREVKIRNAAIRSWLYRNWYKISYFKIGTQLKYDNQSPQFDSLWVQSLALGVLRKSGLRARMITDIALILKFEKLRRNSALITLKKSISK